MKTMVFCLMAAFGTLGGCSAGDNSNDGGGSGPAEEQLVDMSRYCEAACTRLHDCDNTRDQSTCVNNCENNTAVIGPKLRTDYIERIRSCILGVDCASMLSGTAERACVAEANAALAPSSAGVALCEAWANAATQCGQTMNKAACLDVAKQYNDSSLNEARGCTNKSCTEIVNCIEAALAVSLTAVGAGSGANSCDWAYDGECDEPIVCAPGTDTYDCAY